MNINCVIRPYNYTKPSVRKGETDKWCNKVRCNHIGLTNNEPQTTTVKKVIKARTGITFNGHSLRFLFLAECILYYYVLFKKINQEIYYCSRDHNVEDTVIQTTVSRSSEINVRLSPCSMADFFVSTNNSRNVFLERQRPIVRGYGIFSFNSIPLLIRSG